MLLRMPLALLSEFNPDGVQMDTDVMEFDFAFQICIPAQDCWI
jgi:hypothetical protein